MARRILIAVRDLLFASKIDAAAKRLGIDLSWSPRNVPLSQVVRERRPDVVIADLGEPGILGELGDVKGQAPATHLLGFVGHVRDDLVREAEAAGVDVVLARGEMSARLDEILLRERGDVP